MTNVNVADLKEEIKKLAENGRAQNALLVPLGGPDRQSVRLEKRAIGRTARAHLLAYALLRGIPYGLLERSTRTSSWAMRRLLDEVSALVRERDPSGDRSVADWIGAAP